jgi:hypothetical protein
MAARADALEVGVLASFLGRSAVQGALDRSNVVSVDLTEAAKSAEGAASSRSDGLKLGGGGQLVQPARSEGLRGIGGVVRPRARPRDERLGHDRREGLPEWGGQLRRHFRKYGALGLGREMPLARDEERAVRSESVGVLLAGASEVREGVTLAEAVMYRANGLVAFDLAVAANPR